MEQVMERNQSGVKEKELPEYALNCVGKEWNLMKASDAVLMSSSEINKRLEVIAEYLGIHQSNPEDSEPKKSISQGPILDSFSAAHIANNHSSKLLNAIAQQIGINGKH